MWHKWTTLLLVCCALVKAEETTVGPVPVATTRAPPRTLDRQAAELAWRTWLQSPESGNQNAPPRRITTKSLFITPLVCPKGQRLDSNGCVQVLTIDKGEHERNLLAQLNALFTPAPSGDLYDYGDSEPGPYQLSIPIGLDPLASALQGQDPSTQAQEQQESFIKFNKKDKPIGDPSIEAELEILKLQNSNYTAQSQGSNGINNNNLYLYPDKPKRDSAAVNVSDTDVLNKNSEDVGQKEVVFGHVNIDPVIYHPTDNNTNYDNGGKDLQDSTSTQTKPSSNSTDDVHMQSDTVNKTETLVNATTNFHNAPQVLKKDGDQTKLNPENDYSDIGEAIKLISRYAEVTTDDSFAKDQKKNAFKDDGVLGTRTRLQHRRNKPKGSETVETSLANEQDFRDKPTHTHSLYSKNGVYYRYPWPSQHAPTPPPDYPFRHLQDYWPGRNKIGGVYNTHENPRRHHHSYTHNFRPHNTPYVDLSGLRDAYPEQLKGYIHRVAQHHASPERPHTNNQDLYSLLGLRHWFSSEGTSKR